jgi:hypothetical protein
MTALAAFSHSRSERTLRVEDEAEEEDWGRESKLCLELLQEGNEGLKEQAGFTQSGRSERFSQVPASPKVLDFRKSSKSKLLTDLPFASPTSTASRSPPQPPLTLSMPRYSHGRDPAPHLHGTFMYQRPYTSKPRLVDQSRKSYEIKFERYRKKLAQQRNPPQTASSPPILLDSANIRQLKQWFAELDRRKTGLVPRHVIVKFWHDNPEAAELFALDSVLEGADYMGKTEEILGNIGGNEAGLTLDEFLSFYQISENNKDPSVPSTELSCSGATSQPLLPPNISTLIASIYREISSNSDHVSRSEYLNRLQTTPEIAKEMGNPAVLLENQELTLGQVMSSIAQEEALFVEWEEIAMWLGFTAQSDKDSFVMMKETDLAAVKDIFDFLSVETDLAPTHQFTNEVRAVLPNLRDKPVREPRGLSKFPAETLDQVFDRIEENGKELLTWDQFMGYISTRGEPETGYDSEPDVDTQSLLKTYDRPPRSLSNEELRAKLPLGERYAITIPKAFTFNTRERAKRKPIRQIKLEAMLAEKEEKDMAPCRVRIHAQDVPAEVVIPAFDRIMKEQEDRRKAVHKASLEITKSREKPFSFYYRDLGKGKKRENDTEMYVFKANPIPWECTVPLYERMMTEGSEKRKERIETRAKTMLSQAKLHPRMQLYYGESIVIKKPEAPIMPIETVKTKAVPDFTALQTQFQRTLDAKKRSFQSTVPQPFHFNESRKTSDYREYLDVEKASKLFSAPQKANLQQVFRKPTLEPSSTEKHKGLVELRKKEQAKREAAIASKKAEDAARQARKDHIRPLVQDCDVITDNTKALSERRQATVKEAHRRAREEARAFQEDMEKMMERVYARPLLVEQVAEEAKRRSGKMRAMMEQQRDSESDEGIPFSEESEEHR